MSDFAERATSGNSRANESPSCSHTALLVNIIVNATSIPKTSHIIELGFTEAVHHHYLDEERPTCTQVEGGI